MSVSTVMYVKPIQKIRTHYENVVNKLGSIQWAVAFWGSYTWATQFLKEKPLISWSFYACELQKYKMHALELTNKKELMLES